MYYGDQGRYHKGFKGVDGPPVHRVKLRHSSVVTTRPPFYGATRDRSTVTQKLNRTIKIDNDQYLVCIPRLTLRKDY